MFSGSARACNLRGPNFKITYLTSSSVFTILHLSEFKLQTSLSTSDQLYLINSQKCQVTTRCKNDSLKWLRFTAIHYYNHVLLVINQLGKFLFRIPRYGFASEERWTAYKYISTWHLSKPLHYRSQYPNWDLMDWKIQMINLQARLDVACRLTVDHVDRW